MKKIILLGSVLCISLWLSACSEINENQKEKEPNTKKEEQAEGEFLTDEEIEEINTNVEKALRENVVYKFAKITKIQGTKIDLTFFNTPKDYDDKGYNENLDIDTSKLNETGENDTIDLIGVNTNILPADIRTGIYVRIGTYECEEENNLGFEQGQVISVDKVN